MTRMNGKQHFPSIPLCRRAEREFHISFENFLRDLSERGYSPSAVRSYGGVANHFGRWLCKGGIRPCRIVPIHLGTFLRSHLPRCHCPNPGCKSFGLCRAALGCFIGFLRRSCILTEEGKTRVVLTGADRLIRAFDEHLERVQGLTATTRRARRRYARELLVWRFGKKPLRMRTIVARDLFRFVNVRARTLKATSLHALAVGLRSFLRFLELAGRIRRGLAYAVPAPVSPPPRQPARILDRQARLRFLSSFNRETSVGRRNYAIALCLSELALRANELVELALDDVDWRRQTLRLRQTKQRRERLLPLPSPVARALADYLRRGRPVTAHRVIFVRHRAPVGQALRVDGVRHMIRRAFAECGLEATGPHTLRQAWATAAYQRGTGLKLIADILGHESLDTTAPYTQVHFEELRQAALPWPRRKA
jgi:site-specific recombinase XerD